MGSIRWQWIGKWLLYGFIVLLLSIFAIWTINLSKKRTSEALSTNTLDVTHNSVIATRTKYFTESMLDNSHNNFPNEILNLPKQFPSKPSLPKIFTPSSTMILSTYTHPAYQTPLTTITPTSLFDQVLNGLATPSDTLSSVITQIPPKPMPMIGAETHKIWDTKLLDRFNLAGIGWTRFNAILWSDIEPVEGERNWEAISNIEHGLIALSKRNINLVLIVRSTPLWAQKVDGSFCGPVRQEKLQRFAWFMADLVARYSQPPYNVKYWELGNEPDIDPSLVKGDNIFGCWGDSNDPFYGGGYYAEMLKLVYPAVKSVDPDAKILIGGLLLDCDPTHPPEGKDCLPAKFLEGILANNGREYFDMVSFHGYPNYNGTLNMELEVPAWQPRGGTTLGRADYLREVMSKYGISKPLLLTESSLLCPEWNKNYCDPPGYEFFEAQADYAVRMYVRNWADGISGIFWYHMEGPGWRYCGLTNTEGEPKQAYRALQFFSNKIGSSTYNQTHKINDSVKAYEFFLESQKVWVIWSDDNVDYRIPLPPGVINIYDKYGNTMYTDQDFIIVNSPVYLDIMR